MPTETITITETGCHLDNHRGHYITRDVIQLAQGFGFIIGQFEQWAIDTYGMATDTSNETYPYEALTELADEAIVWLNSGQEECLTCGTSGKVFWDEGRHIELGAICKRCSGKGRGPRIAGQNFPPVIPDGTEWSYNDGDFGLYAIESDDDIDN
jgi:hypothetical protein